MSTHSQNFLSAAKTAGPLQEALRSACNASSAQVSAITAARGHVVSLAELEAFMASQPLPDDALDGASGGLFSFEGIFKSSSGGLWFGAQEL